MDIPGCTWKLMTLVFLLKQFLGGHIHGVLALPNRPVAERLQCGKCKQVHRAWGWAVRGYLYDPYPIHFLLLGWEVCHSHKAYPDPEWPGVLSSTFSLAICRARELPASLRLQVAYCNFQCQRVAWKDPHEHLTYCCRCTLFNVCIC